MHVMSCLKWNTELTWLQENEYHEDKAYLYQLEILTILFFIYMYMSQGHV